MKVSRRNIANMETRLRERLKGPPKVSKYAAKNGRGYAPSEPNDTGSFAEDLASHFNKGASR